MSAPLRRVRYIDVALVFGFVFSSLAFTGVPILSRLPFVFQLILLGRIWDVVLVSRATRLRSEFVGPLVFILVMALCSIGNYDQSGDTFMSIVSVWVGALTVSFYVSRRGVGFDIVIHAFMLAALANAISVLVGFDSYAQFSADFREVSEEALGLRASGLVGNANVMAVQALLPLFGALLWVRFRRFGWVFWSLALIVGGYTLVVSGSRKGLLLLFLFLVLGMATFFARSKARSFVAGTLVLCVGLITFQYFGSQFDARDLVAVDRVFLALSGDDQSFDDRSDFLSIGWLLFLQSPIVGHGVDSFRHLSGVGLYSHNNFIELAVSGGVIALLAFYVMHLIVLRGVVVQRPVKRPKVDSVIKASVLVVLLLLDVSMVTFLSKAYAYILCLLLVDAVGVSRNVARSGY